MDDRHMAEIIRLLEKELEQRELPIVSHLAEKHRDPFEILISTLLSLRTKDEVTAVATETALRPGLNPRRDAPAFRGKDPQGDLPRRILPEKGRDDPHTSAAI